MQRPALDRRGIRDRPLQLRPELQQSSLSACGHDRNLIQLVRANQKSARRSEAEGILQ